MQTNNIATPVGFIRFHGHTLLVVSNNNIDYVNAKVLSDLIGLAWRKTRETIQSGDNLVLYGTTRLITPSFDDFEDPRVLKTANSGGLTGVDATENPSQKGSLHIRLDRSRMFMARVNTSQMRAQGNVDAAETLLALQIEWADVLHQYETSGVAIKKANRETEDKLLRLIKARGTPPTAQEREVLTTMIAASIADMGYEIPADPQQSLPGV